MRLYPQPDVVNNNGCGFDVGWWVGWLDGRANVREEEAIIKINHDTHIGHVLCTHTKSCQPIETLPVSSCPSSSLQEDEDYVSIMYDPMDWLTGPKRSKAALRVGYTSIMSPLD